MFFVVKYTENTISFYSRVKMYRFHPGVKDACKQKIFHPEAKSHSGANFKNNTCKLPHILHFLLGRPVKEERIFMDFC